MAAKNVAIEGGAVEAGAPALPRHLQLEVTSAGNLACATCLPCCVVMGDDRVAMGDLRETKLADVRRGETQGRFRAALLTDTSPAVSFGCSLYRGMS